MHSRPILDEERVAAIVREQLGQQPAPQPSLGKEEVVRIVEEHVPKPTVDASAVEAVVLDMLARFAPTAVQAAMEAQIAQTAAELGRVRADHERRLAELRAQLEAAERDAQAARLKEEAAKLVRSAIHHVQRTRQEA